MDPTDITFFARPADFAAWLSAHHGERDALWVGFWKKATGRASITWPESVDEALCFGWIDGIRKRVDDDAYTIRFTPRRSGSIWSLRNMERYTALLAAGRIHEAGAAAFARRIEEKTGTYSFEQKKMPELSVDFLARLEAEPRAWADWQARPAEYRRQVAHWVMSAKREETRERRLAALITDCAAGRKVKPLR